MSLSLTVEQHYGWRAEENKGVRALSKWATLKRNAESVHAAAEEQVSSRTCAYLRRMNVRLD